ncbi:hypothetical protein [Paenibacillus montanisoli]|uniref:Citrate transporter-like domain-containing protein n=1 Tax=Paenibacillus montanisoli TaxID=2081970 RepID=A0A328U4C7_9BACL|nr:hypothetical protein [Paenibacillus montanisoli]RAP77697.1 hypothetical protein DL346_04310 [Paenibacillus montanisoli]
MIAAPRAAAERSVIFSLAAVYIVVQLTHWELLDWILGALVFLAIAVLLPQLKGINLMLTGAFVAGGALLLLAQRADASVWFDAAGINATIVTLFVFAPLFGIPVRLPEYVEALKRFYETKARSRTVMFLGTQALTQIMGVFINVGSIPVVYHLAFVKPRPAMAMLLAGALNRGFAGAIFWSPYFAAMALVTSALAQDWSALLPYLLGLAVLSLVVSLAVDWRGLRGQQTEELLAENEESIRTDTAEAREKGGFPIGLALYLAMAIIVILLLERLIALPMTIITCMAAVAFPMLWCWAKGAWSAYRQGLVHHAAVTLPALKKEITLFLAAGFFSGSVGAAGFGAFVPKLLDPLPLPIDVSFTLFVIVLIVATSMLGLHPIVFVTVLANGIDPLDAHISPIYFAVLLLGSWGISNPISPASAVNNLLAGLFKKSVFELATPNYKFAIGMAAVLTVYLSVIHP